jgi:anti-sigma factor RsiW
MDSNDDLPCQELVELVTDYLEGRLAPIEQRRFEAHLALCRGCRTYLEQMRQTVRALGRLPEASIDPEVKQGLLRALRAWRRGAV